MDQSLAEDLLSRPDDYWAINPTATVALGYRSIDAARAFLQRSSSDRHGQIGFLPLNVPLEVLLSSMRMLFHGEYFLPRSLLEEVAKSSVTGDATRTEEEILHGELRSKFKSLTPREIEVLKLVSEGDSNKEIAKRLGITEHTVKLHIHNLSGKFGVANRTAAANLFFAMQKGGFDAPQ